MRVMSNAPAGNRIRGSSLEGMNVTTTPPEQHNTYLERGVNGFVICVS